MRLGTLPRAESHSWRRRKLRLARAYFSGNPVWCAWQVTYRCNCRCDFCGYWKERPRAEDEQTLAQFDAASASIARMGCLLISLAGGEPLLRNDLEEIVALLARWHMPMMTTNGIGLKPRRARALWRAGLIGASVSLDYAEPARHDRRRGVRGAFNSAVAALEMLAGQRTGVHQRVNMMAVLMHDNLDQMGPLLELASRLGVNFMVQPYCTLKTGDERFAPPAGSARTLLDLKRRYPRFLSNERFLARFDEALNGGVGGCLAGRAFFNIDNYCRVAPCVEKRSTPVGNLAADPLDTLLEHLHKAHDENRCGRCWYNCRGEVESLYSLKGALNSLPILLLDTFKNRRDRTG